MAEYLIQDRDKAAFINRMNKLLDQLKPGLELKSEDFIDLPESGEEDACIFVSNDDVTEKLLDTMIDKKVFIYKIKKIDLDKTLKEFEDLYSE